MLKRLLPLGTASVLFASGADNNLSLHYEYYEDANRVWSATPGVDAHIKLAKHWNMSMGGEVDGVSGASRVSPPSVYEIDGVSGASVSKVPSLIDGLAGASTVEFRKSGNIHGRYENNGTIADVGYYYSKENDYVSHAPSLDLATDLFARNTTLGLSLSYYSDRFENRDVYYHGNFGSAPKKLTSVQGSITQSLTPLTLVSASAQQIHTWGYLSKPYNPILVPLASPITLSDGTVQYYESYFEALPENKMSYAYSGELVQGFHLIPDALGSLRIKYRYYTDDWGIRSHTIDNELSQYLTESLYVRFRYRFYTQTGANFVYATYNGTEPYRTADIKFYPFISNLFGIKFGGGFPDAWAEAHFWIPTRWNIKADYTIRNTHGSDLQQNAPGVPFLYQYFPVDQYYHQYTIMTGVDYDF